MPWARGERQMFPRQTKRTVVWVWGGGHGCRLGVDWLWGLGEGGSLVLYDFVHLVEESSGGALGSGEACLS